MFRKIKENIIKEIMYKGIAAYSDALLEHLEKNFKEKDIEVLYFIDYVDEFTIQGKNTKGTKIQKFDDGAELADFLPINDTKDITISTSNSIIKISTKDVPLLSKGAQGVKALTLKPNVEIIKLY